MYSRSLLALMLLTALGFGRLPSAEVPPPAPDKKRAEEIDLLIKQLASQRLDERNEAANKLSKMDNALPALRKAMSDQNPEVRRSATILVEKIAVRLKDSEAAKLLTEINRDCFDGFIDRMVNTKGYATEERWELMLRLAGLIVERANELGGSKFTIPNLAVSKMAVLAQPATVCNDCRVLINGANQGIFNLSRSLILSNGCLTGVSAVDNSILFINGDLDGVTSMHNCVIFCTGDIGMTTLVEDSLLVAAGHLRGLNTARRTFFQVRTLGRHTIAENNVYLNAVEVGALKATGNRFIQTSRGPLQFFTLSDHLQILPLPKTLPPGADVPSKPGFDK